MTFGSDTYGSGVYGAGSPGGVTPTPGAVTPNIIIRYNRVIVLIKSVVRVISPKNYP